MSGIKKNTPPQRKEPESEGGGQWEAKAVVERVVRKASVERTSEHSPKRTSHEPDAVLREEHHRHENNAWVSHLPKPPELARLLPVWPHLVKQTSGKPSFLFSTLPASSPCSFVIPYKSHSTRIWLTLGGEPHSLWALQSLPLAWSPSDRHSQSPDCLLDTHRSWGLQAYKPLLLGSPLALTPRRDPGTSTAVNSQMQPVVLRTCTTHMQLCVFSFCSPGTCWTLSLPQGPRATTMKGLDSEVRKNWASLGPAWHPGWLGLGELLHLYQVQVLHLRNGDTHSPRKTVNIKWISCDKHLALCLVFSTWK